MRNHIIALRLMNIANLFVIDLQIGRAHKKPHSRTDVALDVSEYLLDCAGNDAAGLDAVGVVVETFHCVGFSSSSLPVYYRSLTN